jgi:hypothetical protein
MLIADALHRRSAGACDSACSCNIPHFASMPSIFNHECAETVSSFSTRVRALGDCCDWRSRLPQGERTLPLWAAREETIASAVRPQLEFGLQTGALGTPSGAARIRCGGRVIQSHSICQFDRAG